MILNQAQAEAVYSAMCALNNVSGRINNLTLPAPYYVIEVRETANGGIVVSHGPQAGEIYENQAAFATAYGLS